MPPSNLQRSAIVAACADMIRACGLTLAELADELAKPQQAQPLRMLPVAGDVDIDAIYARKPAALIVTLPTVPTVPAARALNENDRRVIDAADSPSGITVAGVMELLGLQEAQAHRILSLLADGRHVTRVKKPGIRAMHFFARPADALAWSEATGQPSAAVPVPAAPFPEPAPAAAPAVAALSAAEVRSVEIHQSKVAGSKKAPAPLGPRTPHKPKPAPHQNVTFSPPKPTDEARPRGEAKTDEKTVYTLDNKQRPTARWQELELPPDPRYPSFASMRPGVNPDTGKAWGAQA